MNINATFFIQLFHFLIGYLMLELLLFRPWFKVIDNESQQKHEQERLLKIAQERVSHKEQFKQEQWHEFQIGFAQAMPHITSEPEFFSLKRTTGVSLSERVDTSRLNTCKKEVEQLLFARLTHE